MTVRLKMLESSAASGVRLSAGKTVSVSDADASVLLRLGRAQVVAKKPPVAKPSAADGTGDAE